MFTVETRPPVRGPVQFKPLLFSGQLYIRLFIFNLGRSAPSIISGMRCTTDNIFQLWLAFQEIKNIVFFKEWKAITHNSQKLEATQVFTDG